MFESRQITKEEYELLVDTIRNGYTDMDGITRKPNPQVADFIVLEANLGCRINDILALRTTDFVLEGGVWRMDIIEQKTKKRRTVVVPSITKAKIDEIAGQNYSDNDKLFSICAGTAWKYIRICTRSLGMKDVSSHSFRKFAAMNLYIASDYNVELVSQWLNHSSVDITRRYLKISSKEMVDALNKSVCIA